MRVRDLLGGVAVVPVVVVDDLTDAVPLARRLVADGMPAIEVTLRTACALDAIRAIAAEVEGAIAGAGTVRTPADAEAAVAAGARFLVSPGSTAALLDALAALHVPWLPGAATASEVMALAERGISEMKFFPAEASGGAPAVEALAGPFPDLAFCPTGGITAESAERYLALPNVFAVGGSWMTAAAAA